MNPWVPCWWRSMLVEGPREFEISSSRSRDVAVVSWWRGGCYGDLALVSIFSCSGSLVFIAVPPWPCCQSKVFLLQSLLFLLSWLFCSCPRPHPCCSLLLDAYPAPPRSGHFHRPWQARNMAPVVLFLDELDALGELDSQLAMAPFSGGKLGGHWQQISFRVMKSGWD